MSPNSGLGGAEAVLQTLVEAFPGPVVALEPGPFVDLLRERGHQVEVIAARRGRGMLRGALALRRAIRSSRASVVHANGLKAAVLAGAAAFLTPVRVLWMKHDAVGDGPLAALGALACDEVLGVSDSVLQTFRWPLRRRTVRVYNGLPDRTVDRAAARRRVVELIGRDPAGGVVALCARLAPGKGQDELMRAAPSVLARRPDTAFLLIGGDDPAFPNHGDELRAAAAELGVAEAFLFAGRREDAVELVAGSDVLAAPSVRNAWGWQEGFGLAAAEAMQVGTAVVAYASGSLPEVVGDAGVVVPERDTENLASALADLLQSPAERERLAAMGRARVAESFRQDDALRRIGDRYRALAGAGRHERRNGWRRSR